jgi:hypothetical protein
MSKRVALLDRFCVKIFVLRLILILQIHVIDTLLKVTHKGSKKLLNEVKITFNYSKTSAQFLTPTFKEIPVIFFLNLQGM